MSKRRAVLAVKDARLDTPCPCGAMILAGDAIAGPTPQGRWLHLGCARRAYRLANEPEPELVRVASRADRTSRPRRSMSHRQVNGSRLFCPSCGKRIILGRDGEPVPLGDGRYRHQGCPPPRITRTS